MLNIDMIPAVTLNSKPNFVAMIIEIVADSTILTVLEYSVFFINLFPYFI